MAVQRDRAHLAVESLGWSRFDVSAGCEVVVHQTFEIFVYVNQCLTYYSHSGERGEQRLKEGARRVEEDNRGEGYHEGDESDTRQLTYKKPKHPEPQTARQSFDDGAFVGSSVPSSSVRQSPKPRNSNCSSSCASVGPSSAAATTAKTVTASCPRIMCKWTRRLYFSRFEFRSSQKFESAVPQKKPPCWPCSLC